ncbi:DUF5793 family protein [Halomicroarcula sp. GCM10025324]|jgi:hypothetical protein|uniref:DUF5793 family protein n=1 Tax=Haloarcula TaxID=2237 RepID=UPI0023E88046|nr:DUF5793 family protein [Halomicroarcula sp. ZS-22-S1]
MRRDYFTVDVHSEPADEGTPTISIEYTGPSGGLRERLAAESGTLDADDIDVTLRHQPSDEDGVLSLSNRLTGEYILEATVPTAAILKLVTAAEDRDDGQYEVRLTDADGKSLVYEKQTLLVYDHDGSLRRSQSLIPGGVQL